MVIVKTNSDDPQNILINPDLIDELRSYYAIYPRCRIFCQKTVNEIIKDLENI